MQGNRKPRPAEPTATITTPVVTSSEILTVAEVAALLKVPASSIYEWCRFRSTQRTPIPHRKVGKYLRFLRSEVEAWLLGLPQAANTRRRKYTRKPDAPAPAAPVKTQQKGRAA